MSTTNNTLPQNDNPSEDICIPVYVPNDTEWLWTLAKAVSFPTLQRYWVDTHDGKRDEIRRTWEARVYSPLVDKILDGVLCIEEEGGEGSLGQCFRMDTTTEVFSFFPNDPFTDPFNSEGSVTVSQMRWTRWADLPLNAIPFLGDILEGITGGVLGYFPNDVFLNLDSFPLLQNPIERIADILSVFVNFPFPTVFIELEGEGQFEIELVNVPYGGLCLLIPDLDLSFSAVLDIIIEWFDSDGDLPAFWVMTELDRDILQGELVATQVQEFEFVGDERHTMHAVFIPQPTIEPPFLNPFGGIREIEACGSLRVIGSQTGEIFTKQNYGVLDTKRKGVTGTMTTDEICAGVICAFEEIAQRILFSADKDNILAGISVDKDTGQITISQAQIDRDDISGTSQEKRMGGNLFQANKIKRLFADINDYIDIPYGVSTIQDLTMAFVGIDPIADLDAVAAWDDAILAYASADPELTIDENALALRFFCNGTASGLQQYAIADEAMNEANLNLFSAIVNNIPKTTYSEWYNEGSLTPKDGYQAAPCYKFPDVVSVYDTSDLSSQDKQLPIQPAFDDKRQYRVEISGSLTGDTYHWDGMFLTQGAAVPQYTPLQTRAWESFAVINETDNPVTPPSYSVTGTYKATYEIFRSTPNDMALWGYRVPTQIQTDTNVSGSITVKFIDLGNPDA